ncbi:MAG: YicC/YloC family endoribonuclease [Tropicimonas sp.]|uniref:YicC/YloC family endoribonuclease n=1 Tax=Tropicimonas sp. TaxID=2067044 RepID=UPI003A83EF36
MVNSMTGFAARTGQGAEHGWTWDIRSVNSRGLDLRLRLPEWVEGLEAALRSRLTAQVRRGSLTLGLKLAREDGERQEMVDRAGLAAALRVLAEVARSAGEAAVTVTPASATEVLAMKGVLGQGAQSSDPVALRDALLDDFDILLTDFLTMRANEGAALTAILSQQIDRIESLLGDAGACLDARSGKAAQSLREALARVLEMAEGLDEDRIAQELALLAVKADITEELDRLAAHVGAARALLAQEGPVGRKLEFLTQEFNREVNTLCSKSQDIALTRIGLDLKAVIDQMREQVQNVE